MATTSKLVASNGYYGYDSYSNSAANHLYVGAENSSTQYDYRSRLTFRPLSSIAAIGSNRIAISKVLLYLRRNDGGPTSVTVGCSNSSKWGAAPAATKTATVGSTSQWYSIDITGLATAIGAYTANWYIHLSGGTPRLRLNGTGSDYVPYIKVTWEYVAATIASNSDEAALGSSVMFSITPEVTGETHTLTYAIGDQSDTIATNAGNTVYWTPPLDLATEFPDDDTGTVQIRMTAYNSAGTAIRTELLYQTVTAPDSMKPTISSAGVTLQSGLSGYGLTGRSSLSIAPTVSMAAAYGARLVRVTAKITDGGNVQELTWSTFSENSPGVLTAAAQASAALVNAGSASVQVTALDSRGRETTSTSTLTVASYSPPQIALFSVERYEPVYDANEAISGYVASDLGGYVWVNMQASVSSVAPNGTQLNSLAWRIDGVSDSGKTVTASGSASLSTAIAQNRTLISGAVDEGESWQYTLTVTDAAGGSSAQYSVVLPAHAAMSVSPDKYGLAVGMIAGGTKSAPKFEVAEGYESIFHGGVRGVTNYSAEEVATGGTWIDGKPIYRRVVAVTGTADTSATVDLSSAGIGHVVNIGGSYYMKSDNPYFAPVGFWSSRSVSGSTVYIYTRTYFQNGVLYARAYYDFDAWIVIEYTKT